MQQKYVEHYTALLFHRWLMKICEGVGDSPFRSVVQNFLYYQNPEEPSKVRLQSFITGLVDFIEKVKTLEDPDPAPTLVELEFDKALEAKTLQQQGSAFKLMRPPLPDTGTHLIFNKPAKLT